MQRILVGLAAAMVAALFAFSISACGDDDEEETVTERETQTQTQPQTQTQARTQTQTAPAAQTPADCGPNQAFSQGQRRCVEINQGGGNPCPKGEVPMADRPICVPQTGSGGSGQGSGGQGSGGGTSGQGPQGY